MKKYAYAPNNVVSEVFYVDGDIKELRHPDFVSLCYELSDGDAVSVGWVRKGQLFVKPISSDSQLADEARAYRATIFREFYDPEITISLRELRCAKTDNDRDAALKRISELDAYAKYLQKVPDQEGFPSEINWPTTPTPEASP